MEQDLTLREALAADRLDDFVRQKVIMGPGLVNGSELERALALLMGIGTLTLSLVEYAALITS